MAGVLIFAEFSETKLKKGTLELLSVARQSGLPIHAVLLGGGASKLTDALGQEGVESTIVGDHPEFDRYSPELFMEAVLSAIKKIQPSVVLAPSTLLGRDLFPRVGAHLQCGVISDCTELLIEASGEVKVRRPLYAGKCSAAVRFKDSSLKIILMRANQIQIVPSQTKKSPQVEALQPPKAPLSYTVREVVRGTSGKLDLTEANIIVSGGRGLKDPANFKLLEDLAEVLGATVGASRAVVDAGWVPHSMQVGQTGKTVAPALYFACGISGAIQHMAGMSASKVIVAINSDPNAPIFQKATYGIVGDALTILPMLTQEFKTMLAH